jgi:hypothetical protein
MCVESSRALPHEVPVDSDTVESELERRRRLLHEVVAEFEAKGIGLRMEDNLPRDRLYDRPCK